MKLLDKMERKAGGLAIPNLMLLIVAGMLTVFVVNLLTPQLGILNYMVLTWGDVMNGQVWRLISFIFVPLSGSPIWIFFTLYFYYLIGSTLEHAWGTFRFNIYYLIGILCMILAAALTGASGNMYLNLSLFFAFAVLNPNFQVMLFFIIPVKIKYLAYLNAALFVVSFITGGASARIQILLSLVNFLLFFGGDIYRGIQLKLQTRKNRKRFDYWK